MDLKQVTKTRLDPSWQTVSERAQELVAGWAEASQRMVSSERAAGRQTGGGGVHRQLSLDYDTQQADRGNKQTAFTPLRYSAGRHRRRGINRQLSLDYDADCTPENNPRRFPSMGFETAVFIFIGCFDQLV